MVLFVAGTDTVLAQEIFADQQIALDKFSVNALCKVRRTYFCSACRPEAPNVLSEAILDSSISIKNL